MSPQTFYSAQRDGWWVTHTHLVFLGMLVCVKNLYVPATTLSWPEWQFGDASSTAAFDDAT